MLDRDDVSRFRRELNALLTKAAGGDPEGFAQAVQLVELARDGLAVAAERLREREGYSWADLALPLGVTRQGAAQRFARIPEHDGCPDCGDDAIMPRIDCEIAGIWPAVHTIAGA